MLGRRETWIHHPTTIDNPILFIHDTRLYNTEIAFYSKTKSDKSSCIMCTSHQVTSILTWNEQEHFQITLEERSVILQVIWTNHRHAPRQKVGIEKSFLTN